MNIEFEKVENEARFIAQNGNVNKDDAASDAIKKALLEAIPESNILFQDTNKRIRDSGRNLMLMVNYCSTNYTAQTLECANNIIIEFHHEKSNMRIKDVFIHELGEADYIARNLPDIEDLSVRDKIKNRILELFSHKHVHDLLNMYKLKQEDIKQDFKENIFIKDFVKGKERWETVLSICWVLVSFPTLQGEKKDLKGYIENSRTIEAILDIIKSTNTLVKNNDEIKRVEVNINKVLDILKSIGLLKINVKSRLT